MPALLVTAQLVSNTRDYTNTLTWSWLRRNLHCGTSAAQVHKAKGTGLQEQHVQLSKGCQVLELMGCVCCCCFLMTIFTFEIKNWTSMQPTAILNISFVWKGSQIINTYLVLSSLPSHDFACVMSHVCQVNPCTLPMNITVTSESIGGYFLPLLFPRHLVFPSSRSWHQNPLCESNLKQTLSRVKSVCSQI